MRTVAEWIGKHDDQAIPPRVKDRILRKADDCCKRCGRAFMGKLRPEFHHVIPLILGGANCETNLEAICSECHKAQSKIDVRLKAKVARVRSKHLGLKTEKRNPMPGSKASGFRRRMDGTVERRS